MVSTELPVRAATTLETLTGRLRVCKVLMATPVLFCDNAGALLKGLWLSKKKIKLAVWARFGGSSQAMLF